MTTYYYETDSRVSWGGHGSFQAENDQLALDVFPSKEKLLVLYKEADTPDGTPFIIIWERKRN